MGRKVLIIGLDGGTWDILRPAMDEGYMPYLKEIVDSGASGILESTLPAITPAAWGSFQTGVNCGRNGVFDFAYWDKSENKAKFVSSSTLQKTIWEMASEADKRVGVINVPMTYPPRKINGCMVTGILTPSLESEFTYPPELKEQLLDSVPDYHVFNLQNAGAGSPHENFDEFINQMIKIVDNRTKAARYLIGQNDFDLLMVHYQATDILQHAMWGYMDGFCPLFDKEKRDQIFERFFKHLDGKIKEVHDVFAHSAGDKFLTMIVSDHGQEYHKKRVNLGNWLCGKGFLERNAEPKKKPWLKKITSILKIGRVLKSFISEEAVKRLECSVGLNFEQINWRRSRAFSYGRSGEGFIYILSEDETESGRIIDEITEELKKLTDSESGEKVVKSIFLKKDIFEGPYMNRMPDIIAEPEAGYSFTGLYQEGEGLFHKVEPVVDFHIGKHNKNGIIVANGPDIKCQDNVKCRLIDIVPTLLYYMQINAGSNFDGVAVEELFQEAFRSQIKPSEISGPEEDKARKEAAYSESEEKEIETRLKDLGYF